jgi:hypothetical protein
MYEELFKDLRNKKSELSDEEYKEIYNSIKDAKINSDYLNLNTNTCRCGNINDIRYISCNINNLLHCVNGFNIIKKVPYLEYFLHDMTEFVKVKIVDTLEVEKDKKHELSFDNFISVTKYLLRNFEVLFTQGDDKNVKHKIIYIIGVFNFVLQHSYYLYNVKVYVDISRCKVLVNALYNKIIDIKQDINEKHQNCKIEYINMYDDTIENIVNKQYELVKIMNDYYSEIEIGK